jgi:virginiamycin B lyase
MARPPLRRLLPFLAVLPVVVTTAIAGTLTNPDRRRPCAVEYSKQLGGSLLHMTRGPDGAMWSTDSFDDSIVRFDPETHEAERFPVPAGTFPHDIVAGPDGNVWFGGTNDRIGMIDLATGYPTLFPGITKGSEVHDLAWLGGRLYFAEMIGGRLAWLDPKTRTVHEGTFGLPPDNLIHSMIALHGYLWATLSNANKLVRFDPRANRFDRFVEMPVADSGPRDLIYLRSQNAIYLTLYAANAFARYDLDSGKVTVFRTDVDPLTLADANDLTKRVEKVSFIEKGASETNVYAGTFAAELLRLDVRSGKVSSVHCGITFPAGTAGMARDAEGRLWFNEAFPGRIGRIRP